ncbi:exported hypothetical protein [Hyphomicrobiales bacterium]|nr:exported hypothetical protein [Hyphomicrobiales bacterium]CAH1699462.1 exported hypothetical protein [Hyphomicrobiales bacterium]CAI0343250.1 exported hypothetical protein [Hyphomicrobiales bacterium]
MRAFALIVPAFLLIAPAAEAQNRGPNAQDPRAEACREEARRVHLNGRAAMRNPDQMRELVRQYTRDCLKRGG